MRGSSNSRLLNQDGFTMIEALMIAAVIGVLISAFASFTYQKAKLDKAREGRADYSQLGNNLKNSANQTEGLVKSEELMVNNGLNISVAEPLDEEPQTAVPSACPTNCTYNESTGQCVANLNSSNCSLAYTQGCPVGCTVDPM